MASVCGVSEGGSGKASMGASSLDYTLVYIPAVGDPEALGPQPPYVEVRLFPSDRDVNPLAWFMTKRGGTLLELRVPLGHLSKRRTPSGVLDVSDAEQRSALLDVLRAAVDLTLNRWTIYGYWSGLDAELREIRECGPPEESTLVATETDVLYKFADPQPWPG